MPIIPYWSDYLLDPGTDQETVAEFRKRLNVDVTEPQFTRFNAESSTPVWDSLTQVERVVESLFTPTEFLYIDTVHGPPTIDKTYLEYDLTESRQIEYPDLTFVEKEWITLDRLLELARLRLPTQPINNVFHYFFG